jgi:hypothetical protein
MSFELPARRYMSYELQGTSYEIPDRNYELRDARYKIVPASADLSLHRTLREPTGYQTSALADARMVQVSYRIGISQHQCNL